MTVTELAAQVGLCSVFVLWCALVLSAVPALRQPHQRGLWLTVLAVTIAITLFQPSVLKGLQALGIGIHQASLARNLIGVLSAGMVLLFMIDPSRTRRAYLSVVVGLTAAIGSLLALDLLQVVDNLSIQTASDLGPADQGFFYWLILIFAHLAGDTVALAVCWRNSLRTRDRDLVMSLRLFAAGSSLAIVFWCGYLWELCVPAFRAQPYLSVIMGVHGLLRAASLMAPITRAFVRSTTVLRTTWQLWPLWRDLVTAVPQVTLAGPQRTRLQEVLRPRSPLALQAHRQTIETYDALLELQRYVRPDAYQRAHQHARLAGVRDDLLAAAALAGALGQARRAVLGGAAPSDPCLLPGMVHCSSVTLLGIARMWPSMADVIACHAPAHQRVSSERPARRGST
ncbi:MAB_1171c family putative transporter [Streptomyces beigongshangae]|uniref:MAB_1171c family putative transporter n=1 Tax=Streptomyces beigongshangae TaxID=2841597 RepID=UPI0021A48AA7|nr:MAB_1171c family putative transporter [Streptomyces sp. REN17]